MKKPTIAQLKRRPALWVFDSIDSADVWISMPDNKNFYRPDNTLQSLSFWRIALSNHEELKSNIFIKFVGWL